MTQLKLRDPVLLKFFFNNEKWLPVGIRKTNRATDEVVDAGHRMAELRSVGGGSKKGFAGFAELQEANQRTEKGRLRPARVDTGNNPISNLADTDVMQMQEQLQAAGYILNDVHRYEKPRDKGKAQQVLVLSYSKKGTPFKLHDHQQDAINVLLGATWIANVFDNRTADTSTINLGTINPDRKVDNRLTITAEGDIVASPAT